MPSKIQPQQDGKTKSMRTLPIRNSINRSPLRCGLLLTGMALSFAWLAFSPTALAQEACREGCDFPLASTFLGLDALVNNTTGFGNTANGALALLNNTTGNYNTATGDTALWSNTTGSNNTATGYAALSNNTGNDNTANGAAALYSNTTGARNVATGSSALFSNQIGGDNTATGVNALYYNTGNYNTADGYQALESNTTGSNNTAHGLNALNKNTTGSSNAANGAYALYSNTTASNNTAHGFKALYYNTSGNFNTADGELALYKNTIGGYNTASGVNALYGNTIGARNIALGYSAGFSLTTGSNNIDIANLGVAAESNTIRIGTVGTQTNTYFAGISGVTVAGGVGVIVDTNGHLGTVVSSERFKEAIKPMDKASESVLSLKPVTFRYKQELDPEGIPQFGLVAEEVEKVNPNLVARDDEGKPYTVRYEAVNAMLLNEFLKEYHTVQDLKSTAAKQEATIARQQKQIEALTAGLQKVSAEVEMSKVAPQTVVNNR